jgi:uncharacterized sporulation protein YeaH/YhbH (DUF444 family)
MVSSAVFLANITRVFIQTRRRGGNCRVELLPLFDLRAMAFGADERKLCRAVMISLRDLSARSDRTLAGDFLFNSRS